MLKIKPQGLVGWLADMLMIPFMYILQGTLAESPQQTHRWNNVKIWDWRRRHTILQKFFFIAFHGDAKARKSLLFGFIPLFHMPVFGGWRTFVVLEPVCYDGVWFVGWHPADGSDLIGISRVPLYGQVRLTIGPDEVSFFAINVDGNPIELRQVGKGKIGQAGTFAKVPLL